MNVKLAGVSNKDGKEVRKNIQLRFIGSCRFMPSSLDKLGELWSWENFEESKVPPKNVFYSKLDMKGINDNDYKNAQQVWNRTTPEAGDVTLRDYHDAYLATDLLTCLEHSKLEPGYFYTAPGFA